MRRAPLVLLAALSLASTTPAGRAFAGDQDAGTGGAGSGSGAGGIEVQPSATPDNFGCDAAGAAGAGGGMAAALMLGLAAGMRGRRNPWSAGVPPADRRRPAGRP